MSVWVAKNSEIKKKLRENINQTLNATEEKLSYDTLKDMKYLDMVINGEFSILNVHIELNMTKGIRSLNFPNYFITVYHKTF